MILNHTCMVRERERESEKERKSKLAANSKWKAPTIENMSLSVRIFISIDTIGVFMVITGL